MSLHKTLKSKSALVRHRNVLSRAERIEKLKEEERWEDGTAPFGLPKIAHRKVAVGGKEKKAKTAEEATPGEEKPAEGSSSPP